MWKEKLKTKFAREEVEVVSLFESSTYTTYLKFPDGSQLKLEVKVNLPEDVHSEPEAMDIARVQSAGRWYSKFLKRLRTAATKETLDLDF